MRKVLHHQADEAMNARQQPEAEPLAEFIVTPTPAHDCWNHLAMLHALARPLKDKGKLVLGTYGEDFQSGVRITSKVSAYAIGDVEGMCREAERLQHERHRNIYAGLSVMRPDLPTRAKGEEADIVAVLGVCADFDDDDAGNWAKRLPLTPDYVLETSAGRYQAFFLFDAPQPVAKAKELAERLKAHARCDHGTSDLSHVWRIPGLPNWPSQKKVKLGRSPEPQLVRIAKQWEGRR